MLLEADVELVDQVETHVIEVGGVVVLNRINWSKVALSILHEASGRHSESLGHHKASASCLESSQKILLHHYN